jgi:LysR family glycine cleavage system transcriptional activator
MPQHVIEREAMLPPISALRAFISAAQYSSFTQAADELGVSQSGVSRAIKSIEKLTGVDLFERTGNGLVLTEQGRSYLNDVRGILDSLGAATMRLTTFADTNDSLTIASLPSLGGRWLAPRLGRFMVQYPRIELCVTAQVGQFDIEDSGVDGVIHYGNDAWKDSLSDLLMEELTVPVCIPELVPRGREPSAALLLDSVLIQHTHRPTAWRDWFRCARIAHPQPTIGPRFEQYQMGIEAALAGVGAVLMPPFMISTELALGRLIILDRTPVPSPWRYHFIYPKSKRQKLAVQQFRGWIRQEARRTWAETMKLIR